MLKNSGQIEEAEDIFQEALVVLFRKIKNDTLTLNCSLSTYVYAISRNMWLDKLRRKNRTTGTLADEQEVVDLDDDVINTIHHNERYAVFQKHFQKLGDGCRQLLRMFFKGADMKQITREMSFSSVGYTRKRKFKCKEQLIRAIRQDPAYHELAEGNSLDDQTIK